MPQIIPIKELKNTSEISEMCHHEYGELWIDNETACNVSRYWNIWKADRNRAGKRCKKGTGWNEGKVWFIN